MSNSVLLKKSSVGAKVPLTTDLAYGELALNYADGKLYFKDSSNTIQSFASLTATATETNKTLTSPSLTGTVAITATTLLSINGVTGNSGQYLARGPTGLTWTSAPSPALSSLTDVAISSPTAQQVLTYTGSAWINAASNAVVASAVFATSQSDLGYVYDASVNVSEDEGSVTGIANNIYDLGVLSFTGIISLNNIDQSIKSDYLGYSIIFGF
jgi:hypothetical protein